MKTQLLFVLTGVWFLLAGSSQAAVFERDLVPGSGDGLLTFDDLNNREWLDLTETIVDLFGEIPDSFEERYMRVLDETLMGGRFEGFTVATEADLEAFVGSAGIDINTFDVAVNGVPANELHQLLTKGRGGRGTRVERGFLAEFEDGFDPSCRCIASIGSTANFAGLFFGTINSLSIPSPSPIIVRDTTGVYLYRETVPEPSTALLLAVASIEIVCSRLFL